MKLLCLLAGGDLYRIYVDGRWITFEMHHYCGPMPLHRQTLEPLKSIGPRHKFWSAVQNWCDQGKKTGREIKGQKLCVYERRPIATYID